MNYIVKLVLYVCLFVNASVFGYCFYTNYNRFMSTQVKLADVDTTQSTPTANARVAHLNGSRYSHLLVYGGFFFMSVVGLGLLAGHDFSHFVANRVGRLLYNGEGDTIKDSDYELAEKAWANGNPLEAIQLMRNYLEKNPREQHVALRIAEIYEKDLANPLAAALEYEEVLKQKLSPEQWGWTAIHLCNLYSSKLNKPDKTVALLRRIVNEYGETSAAEKARKRLDVQEEEAGTEEESPGEVEVEEAKNVETGKPRVETQKNESPSPVPPNNFNLQEHFDRFHQGSSPGKPANQ